MIVFTDSMFIMFCDGLDGVFPFVVIGSCFALQFAMFMSVFMYFECPNEYVHCFNCYLPFVLVWMCFFCLRYGRVLLCSLLCFFLFQFKFMFCVGLDGVLSVCIMVWFCSAVWYAYIFKYIWIVSILIYVLAVVWMVFFRFAL